MILCLTESGGSLAATVLPDASTCTGYVAIPASDYSVQTLTIPEANQLIGAVGVLFVLAFLFRAIRKQIGF